MDVNMHVLSFQLEHQLNKGTAATCCFLASGWAVIHNVPITQHMTAMGLHQELSVINYHQNNIRMIEFVEILGWLTIYPSYGKTWKKTFLKYNFSKESNVD